MALEQVGSFFATLGLKVDQEEWKEGDKLLGAAKTALTAIAAFAAGGAIVGVVGDVADLGGAMDDMSQRTGIAAEELQELRLAAMESDIALEAVASTLAKTANTLTTELAKGSGDTIDAFKELGVSTSDLKDIVESGDFNRLLSSVADSFADMPGGIQKSTLAMKAFGKGGVEMIPLLNQGNDGLEEMFAKARDLGLVMSNENVEALADFGDATDDVKFAWQGFKNQIVTGLLPVIKPLVTGFLDGLASVVDWLARHQTEIAAVGHAIVETVSAVIDGFVAAWEISTAIVSGFVTAFVAIWDEIVDSTSNMISAVVDGLSMIGDFFAYLGGRFAVLIDWVVGLQDYVIAAGEYVMELLAPIRDFFFEVIARMAPIFEKVGALFRAIGGRIAGAFRAIIDRGKAMWDSLVAGGRSVVNFFVSVATTIRSAFEAAFDWIRTEVPKLVREIPVIGWIGDKLGKGAAGVVNFLTDGGNENEAGTPFQQFQNANPDSRMTEDEFNAAQQRRVPTAAGVDGAVSSVQRNEFSIGQVNVTTPPGADPAAYASVIQRAVRTSFDEMLDERLGHADATAEEIG